MEQELYYGVIPDIFGAGMVVVDTSFLKCYKALKKEYGAWCKVYPQFKSKFKNFKDAFESYGGRVDKVEIGKVYWEDFGN